MFTIVHDKLLTLHEYQLIDGFELAKGSPSSHVFRNWKRWGKRDVKAFVSKVMSVIFKQIYFYFLDWLNLSGLVDEFSDSNRQIGNDKPVWEKGDTSANACLVRVFTSVVQADPTPIDVLWFKQLPKFLHSVFSILL